MSTHEYYYVYVIVHIYTTTYIQQYDSKVYKAYYTILQYGCGNTIHKLQVVTMAIQQNIVGKVGRYMQPVTHNNSTTLATLPCGTHQLTHKGSTIKSKLNIWFVAQHTPKTTVWLKEKVYC